MTPIPHEFSYRLFMMLLDLDELPDLFRGRWLWSAGRPAVARFRRADHLGDADQPLKESVQELVAQETGAKPQGPIRLLTHLRYFGHGFNPVSFYYCYDKDDQVIETIVAEVNNTPWGERHCYVLPQAQNIGDDRLARFQPEKVFHVSPFMPMEIDYDWCFNQPADSLTVHMVNKQRGSKVFDATLVLKRQEVTGASLARVLALFPFMTVKIVVGIYWQALRLWLKSVPIHDHPGKRLPAAEDSP